MNFRVFKSILILLLVSPAFLAVSAWCRTEMPKTGLPALRSALETPAGQNGDTYIFRNKDEDPLSPEAREGLVVGLQLYEQLISWVVLADSKSANAMLSGEMKRLRNDEPACLKRFFLEGIEMSLSRLDTPWKRRVAFSSVFVRSFFQHSAHRPALDDLELYEGTRSVEFSESAGMKLSLRFLKDLWSARVDGPWNVDPENRQKKLAELLDQPDCVQSINLAKLFPYFDWNASEGVIEKSGSLSTELSSLQIQSLLATSPLQLNVETESSLQAYAYHPVLGVVIDHREIPKQFYSAFFHALESNLLSKRGLSEEACSESLALLTWAGYLGIRFSSLQLGFDVDHAQIQVLKMSYEKIIKKISENSSRITSKSACYKTYYKIQQLWKSTADPDFKYDLPFPLSAS